MPPNLKDSYDEFADCYRDRAKSGGHVYYVRLKDSATAEDADGEPLKFDHAEAVRLYAGESIHAVVNSRTGVYPPAPEPDHEAALNDAIARSLKDNPVKPPTKKRGRPRKAK